MTMGEIGMCSISGFIVTKASADRQAIGRRYLDVLSRGADRGRDSAGVAALDTEGRAIRRVALTPSDYGFALEAITPRTTVLIGNNRAEPTTEFVREKTPDDAQPFGDGPVFVSHNGIIANDGELRTAHRIDTASRIDSAVCPGLIRQLGLREALDRIQGSLAMAVIDARYPHRLWLARNYKPLYLQADEGLGAVFFASRSGHLSVETTVRGRLQDPAVVAAPSYALLEIDGLTGEVREECLAPRERNRRALVICSGGLDSTTAARWAQVAGYDVTLLHFLYGSRAEEREQEAVRAIAGALGCRYRFEDLEWLGHLGGSPLTDPSLPITDNETGAEFAHEWVPARNLLFVAMAAALCDRYGYDTLILGLNLEEGGAYPDNTTEFYELLDQVTDIGTMSRPRILSPLANLVKHQIVRLALDLDAPIQLSWSCYYGGEKHCGHCGPCFMRRTAFRMVGTPDSVVYESD